MVNVPPGGRTPAQAADVPSLKARDCWPRTALVRTFWVPRTDSGGLGSPVFVSVVPSLLAVVVPLFGVESSGRIIFRADASDWEVSARAGFATSSTIATAPAPATISRRPKV